MYTGESWLLTENYDGFYTLNYSEALFTDGTGTTCAFIQMAGKGGHFHNCFLIPSVSFDAVVAIWDLRFQCELVPAADTALTGSLWALTPMQRLLLTLSDDEISFPLLSSISFIRYGAQFVVVLSVREDKTLSKLTELLWDWSAGELTEPLLCAKRPHFEDRESKSYLRSGSWTLSKEL